MVFCFFFFNCMCEQTMILISRWCQILTFRGGHGVLCIGQEEELFSRGSQWNFRHANTA